VDSRARLRIGVGAAVVLVIVAVGCGVLFSAIAPRGTTSVIAPQSQSQSQSQPDVAPTSSGASAFVHILGAVREPGLYELRSGDRVVDAVAAAGGFTPKADESAVNLARFVTDGEQIVVPRAGEAPQAAPGTSAGGLVNINTADGALLETLPGIGPVTAQHILDHREANGGFATIEDLQDVPGIGEVTFAGMRDLVTL
jgi:competence protein ComEA